MRVQRDDYYSRRCPTTTPHGGWKVSGCIDAVTRFQAKRQRIQELYQTELEQLGIVGIDDLEMAIRQLDKDIAE